MLFISIPCSGGNDENEKTRTEIWEFNGEEWKNAGEMITERYYFAVAKIESAEDTICAN